MVPEGMTRSNLGWKASVMHREQGCGFGGYENAKFGKHLLCVGNTVMVSEGMTMPNLGWKASVMHREQGCDFGECDNAKFGKHLCYVSETGSWFWRVQQGQI